MTVGEKKTMKTMTIEDQSPRERVRILDSSMHVFMYWYVGTTKNVHVYNEE